jgi:RNA recognition motif-containing protein
MTASQSTPFIARQNAIRSAFVKYNSTSSEPTQAAQEPAADTTETTTTDSNISSQLQKGSDRVAGAAKAAVENAKETASGIAEQAREAVYGERQPRERRDYGDRQPRERREYRERPAIAPNNKIYVGNLLFEVKDADLKARFEEFGQVKNAVIASDARGLSKGFGYVEFETLEQAQKAVEEVNGTDFEGRKVIVNYQANTATARRPQNPKSKVLFIGNLAFEMTDEDLNKLFRDVKNVIDVRVAIDRRTGQPRGFAHADFVDEESAAKAVELLAGKTFYGRSIRVDYSAPSGPREAREPREPREPRESREDRF